MNNQQLEYVRICLRAALVDSSGSMKGQLEAFAENPPADKDKNPRKHIHLIELENGQCVKADNTAVYVMETRSRRRPHPPIDEGIFSSCVWRRALNTLGEHEQAWLRYCYGFDLTFRFQTLICERVWNIHKNNIPGGMKDATRKRIVSLIWLAAQDVAASNNNETYKAYAGAVLANLLSVHRSTWLRTYSPYWQKFRTSFETLDHGSLQAVLSCYNKMIPEEGN